MADAAIEEAKALLRRRARVARGALSPEARTEASSAICRNFFDGVPLGPDEAVAAYWRVRDEVDCQPILIRLMDSGQTVILPVVTGPDQPLDMRIWEAGTPLFEAGFGTLAPSELAPRRDPDLMLMPLLGFDASGTRLGYGGGYYDRTLAHLPRRPKLIGLAFSAQELDAIPREPHDVPLDAVITEHGARFFGEDR
ncbi:5-formyltetrahydrofolate cyclo-ligase [Devosia albogilva]|uniref:5-formyltetrahydrofolate cyclo-ligase n=1 Tax=Devosia albogilva TaxID=429726 RepID=A0ABW5QIU6_9HYPH